MQRKEEREGRHKEDGGAKKVILACRGWQEGLLYGLKINSPIETRAPLNRADLRPPETR